MLFSFRLLRCVCRLVILIFFCLLILMLCSKVMYFGIVGYFYLIVVCSRLLEFGLIMMLKVLGFVINWLLGM